ncbi:MAG: hypothetical protein Q4B85_11795 [Lachnospiraceae bacterium]|nr:hypothetical protein [Lachnospiraceae bacterium]
MSSMSRDEELQQRLMDLLDEYGYHINGFQRAMKQMIREEKLDGREWQMLQHYTATELL